VSGKFSFVGRFAGICSLFVLFEIAVISTRCDWQGQRTEFHGRILQRYRTNGSLARRQWLIELIGVPGGNTTGRFFVKE
jgi:hypothetical protein